MKWLVVTLSLLVLLLVMLLFGSGLTSSSAAKKGIQSAYSIGKSNYQIAIRLHVIDVQTGKAPVFDIHVVDRMVDSMEQTDPGIYDILLNRRR